MHKKEIEKDFEFLKDEVLAILLFGSQVKNQAHKHSDKDICIVSPKKEPSQILRKVYSNINTESKNYDVHIFEELSLKMKHSIIENHKAIWIKDKGTLQELFYQQEKIWKDQYIARGVQ